MATDIGSRQVLRPAGNVARATLRKAATKPPSSPLKPAAKPAVIPVRASPPNSQPSTPRTARSSPLVKPNSPTARNSALVKPNSPRKLQSPRKLTSSAASPAASPAPKPEPIPCVIEPNPEACILESASTDSNSALTDTATAGSEASPATVYRTQRAAVASGSGAPRPKTPTFNKKSLSKLGGNLSFDESSLASIVAAKKAAAHQVAAQRRLKVAEYGRKPGKVSRVAPDVPSTVSSPPIELRRCKFITAQSDPLYVAYHDEEWGVSVHDDRMLFEILVLSGLQVELSWTTILHKRELYRAAFCGFDAITLATFNEKHIQAMEADKSLGLPKNKVRGVVENAQRIVEVASEFGSLDAYLWGFLNNQPMINNYRYAKQVPVKTSKAESISKDLVKRGFRFVGPTIMYSFMQAAGMTNDHLVECFRHQECQKLSYASPSASATAEIAEISEASADDVTERINEEESAHHEQSDTVTFSYLDSLEQVQDVQEIHCTDQDWLSGEDDLLQEFEVSSHIRALEVHLEEKMAMVV